MNVEFCNGKAFKINAPELNEKVLVECESLFGTKIKRNYFPGPQPVAVELKDLEILKEGYMVCEKTDGTRAILLLINLNNKPMCFVINRNNELYFLDLSFKKEVYEGSIFDGELVKTKSGSWHLLIHDCMVYNGKSFVNENHRLRYACVIDLIVKRYVNKPTDPFLIKTKLFYKFGPQLETTWEHIKKTTENEIDGLIFTPINHPIIFGRDIRLFKWKLPEDNTIDYQIIFKSRKVYFYYIKTELVLYKSFNSTHDNYKKLTEFIKTNGIKEESPIIEFKIINEDYFVPYRYRNDKNAPNGEFTMLNTFKNVKEALQVKDLYLNPAATETEHHIASTPSHGNSASAAANDLASLTSRLSLGSAS
jgi:mRNA guanylyltransferase